MIHPNPASSVEEFHAESVNTEYCPDHRGFGSGLIDGFGDFEIRGLIPREPDRPADPCCKGSCFDSRWGEGIDLSSPFPALTK
ncbi:hypothetical protein F2Q70_00012965 [Brassica cretica]|uniref:Uncharacterized protein n=1 Tax=Brassica cretica TaxID=69181 RepID=A0A8S9MD99_BRACR|nr:hypothetical protein F2Q70_00012965 [Brassica cretica]